MLAKTTPTHSSRLSERRWCLLSPHDAACLQHTDKQREVLQMRADHSDALERQGAVEATLEHAEKILKLQGPEGLLRDQGIAFEPGTGGTGASGATGPCTDAKTKSDALMAVLRDRKRAAVVDTDEAKADVDDLRADTALAKFERRQAQAEKQRSEWYLNQMRQMKDDATQYHQDQVAAEMEVALGKKMRGDGPWGGSSAAALAAAGSCCC